MTQLGLRFLLALAFLSAVPGLAAPQEEPVAGASSEVQQVVERPEYVIQNGDVLGIKFFLNPELNEELTVRPDGRVSLQLIPEVVAAGRTPRELTMLLKELYAPELDRPEISVIVRSFSAQRIYVDGEVERPGEFQLVGSTTVLQAIARAEGFKDTARLNEILLIRRGVDGTPLVQALNVKQIRRGRHADPMLAPFDVVYVPKTAIANVNRWVDQYVRQNIPVSFGFRIETY